MLLSYISCNEQIETEKTNYVEAVEEFATEVIEDTSKSMTTPVQEEVKKDSRQSSKDEITKPEDQNTLDEAVKQVESELEGKKYSIDEGGCYVCGKYISIFNRKKAEYKTQVGYEYRTVWLCPEHYEEHKKRGVNY